MLFTKVHTTQAPSVIINTPENLQFEALSESDSKTITELLTWLHTHSPTHFKLHTKGFSITYEYQWYKK